MSRRRRRARCTECGRIQEIAAHHLCFACYRRDERSRENHDPGAGISAGQKRRIRQYTAVLAGIADLGVGRDDTLAIASRLAPYISDVAEFLNAGRHTQEIAGDEDLPVGHEDDEQ